MIRFQCNPDLWHIPLSINGLYWAVHFAASTVCIGVEWNSKYRYNNHQIDLECVIHFIIIKMFSTRKLHAMIAIALPNSRQRGGQSTVSFKLRYLLRYCYLTTHYHNAMLYTNNVEKLTSYGNPGFIHTNLSVLLFSVLHRNITFLSLWHWNGHENDWFEPKWHIMIYGCCARSRYQGHGQISTSHRYFRM